MATYSSHRFHRPTLLDAGGSAPWRAMALLVSLPASEMKFATVVADPPWPYRDIKAANQQTRYHDTAFPTAGMGRHYPAMPLADLAALPVPTIIAPSAHLYLWTTNAFMVEAHALARAWGFDVKTIITWIKVRKDDSERVSMKTGYYFRGATEHILFGVRGSLRLNNLVALPTAFMWPRLAHSVKPDEFFEMVELASPGPRIELFARRLRAGWTVWGNEVCNTALADI